MVRMRVYLSGRVQGVWFRGTTEKIAIDYAVGGFVQNEPDGRVLLVAEGDRAICEAFLDSVKAAKAPNIDHCDVEWFDASAEFKDFVIRR